MLSETEIKVTATTTTTTSLMKFKKVWRNFYFVLLLNKNTCAGSDGNSQFGHSYIHFVTLILKNCCCRDLSSFNIAFIVKYKLLNI